MNAWCNIFHSCIFSRPIVMIVGLVTNLYKIRLLLRHNSFHASASFSTDNIAVLLVPHYCAQSHPRAVLANELGTVGIRSVFFMYLPCECECIWYEQTHSSAVTYLFHDCERSLVWRVRTLVCDDQSTLHTQLFAPLACCHVLRCVHCLSLASYFDLFFVQLCWISRRHSSGYTFATTA